MFSDLLKILRKLRPSKTIPEDFPDNSRDLSIVKNESAVALLKKHFGQPGWTSLEESLKNGLESL